MRGVCLECVIVFFFMWKTVYEWRISDWSSDVCSSDLGGRGDRAGEDPCVLGGEPLGQEHRPESQLLGAPGLLQDQVGRRGVSGEAVAAELGERSGHCGVCVGSGARCRDRKVTACRTGASCQGLPGRRSKWSPGECLTSADRTGTRRNSIPKS